MAQALARAKKTTRLPRPWHGDKVSKDFGLILSTRRLDLEYTQQQVADRAGVTVATVAYQESSKQTYLPRPRVFWGLARALQLSSSEMFEAAYGSDQR